MPRFRLVPALPLPATALVLAALLAGCQPLTVRDEQAGRDVPLTGGRVVLHRGLTVPGGATRVFLQRGEVVAKRDLNHYAPSCSFQLRELSDMPREIRPDRFEITRAGYGLQEWVQRGPVMVAAARAGGAVLADAGEDDGAAMVMYVIEMRLASARQPEVMSLVCRSALDDPSQVERPSLQQLRAVLGPLASLETP